MQAHDATAVVLCKTPDCPNEAPARGRYAGRCDHCRGVEHRAEQVSPARASTGSTGSLVGKLRELSKLAAKVDKAKSKAATATQKALALKREADKLERELRDRMGSV